MAAWASHGEIRLMRVLFDTNVVLDVLLRREPWAKEAAAVWQANDEGRIVGYILASALTDVFYIACRHKGLEAARVAIHTCLEAFEICAVDRQTLEQADALPGDDFEDNFDRRSQYRGSRRDCDPQQGRF